MSQRITRSMTSSSRRACHHLLALPAEVRSLIIEELISSPACVIREDEDPKYSGACLPLLLTCHALRREAIFILGSSIEIKVQEATVPHIQHSLSIGLWEHLQEVTYIGDAPTLEHIEVFKQLKGLKLLTWEPVQQPIGLEVDEAFDLPDSVDHNKWTSELGFFLLDLPCEHFCFLNGEPFDEDVYEDLDLPFNFNLYLPVYAGVLHPRTGVPGLIDLTIVIDLTVFIVISYNGVLVYHWPHRTMKPGTGPGIEWNGEWCAVDYSEYEMESTE